MIALCTLDLRRSCLLRLAFFMRKPPQPAPAPAPVTGQATPPPGPSEPTLIILGTIAGAPAGTLPEMKLQVVGSRANQIVLVQAPEKPADKQTIFGISLNAIIVVSSSKPAHHAPKSAD
jgi:hypothetical protein